MNDSPHMSVAAADGLFPPNVGPPKILLTTTTRWPSPARLMIGFSGVGLVVSIVCPAHGHPSQKVRVVHNTFPYKPLAPLDSLADAIEAAKPDIIIPCDDLGVRHLHELHSSERARHASEVDIPALIVRSLGPLESYATVDSRYSLLNISREAGIRTPDTGIIENLDDLNRWHAAQPFPWVLKADGTSGGNGVRIARTLAEARGHFSDLRRSIGLLRFIKRLIVDRNLILERDWRYGVRRVRPALVAQSFIPGSPANCAVVCWKGEVLAGIGCEAVNTESLFGPATVVRLIDNAEMMAAARKIARRLSLSGFVGLDFVIEEGTGAAYLIEMNPRCTPPCHLRLGIGRDMIGAFSAQLTGKPLSEPVSVTQNSLIAYFPEALLRNSEFLSSSYHDVPEGESELIQELLRASLRAQARYVRKRHRIGRPFLAPRAPHSDPLGSKRPTE
jgi:ATP-grasp domain-containing protein